MANLSNVNTTEEAVLTSDFFERLSKGCQYISFGSLDTLVNLFILFVLVVNIKLLKKFAFIFGFAVGDLINGLSLFIAGVMRLKRLYDKTLYNVVHPSACMPTVQVYIFGYQMSACMFFFIGVERSIAVSLFSWYHKKWTDKTSWIGNFYVFLFATVALIVSYITSYNQPAYVKIPLECGVPKTVGSVYSIYNFAVAAAGGVMAFVPTLASFFVFNRRKKLIIKQGSSYSASFKQSINKNMKMTKLLLSLAFIDLSMVAVPNMLQILYLMNIITLVPLPNWLLQLMCFRGSLNLLIYMLTNNEFRFSVFKMFKRKVVSSISYVSTIQANGNVVSRL